MYFFAIASEDPEDRVRAFVETFDIDMPVLLDPDGSVHRSYPTESAFPSAAYPEQWVVGPDGTILYHANQYEADVLESVLIEALAR